MTRARLWRVLQVWAMVCALLSGILISISCAFAPGLLFAILLGDARWPLTDGTTKLYGLAFGTFPLALWASFWARRRGMDAEFGR